MSRDGRDCGAGMTLVSAVPRTSYSPAARGSDTRVARLHDPVLVGEHHGLDAVSHPELLEDPRDVRLDGRLADERLGGDLCVGKPARDEPQDLELPRGEVVETGCGWSAGGRRTNSAITRRVTTGESSASPPATTWIASTSCSGGVSLSRKPLAPARSASYTYSSRSNVVRIRMRG